MDDSELESFRRRWREEVSARAKGSTGHNEVYSNPSSSGPGRPTQRAAPPPPSKAVGFESVDDEGEGHSFHDLENKEEYLKLGNEFARHKAAAPKQPHSALEHYEKAVEREAQGSHGDSVKYYRKAFKLDAQVQETYKKKHFPQAWSSSSSKPANPNPSNAAVTVPGTAHHSLDGPSSTISELLNEFSKLSIPTAEPESSLSVRRPCHIAGVPEEVLVEILVFAGLSDVADFSRLSQVCKRFAFLIMSEERIWKHVSLDSKFGFSRMHYRYACSVSGRFLHAEDSLETRPHLARPTAPLYSDLTPSVYPTQRSQFRNRPRIRFNGCYISTVNYTRAGGALQSQFTWNSPVHIVTYYRYLRFFRDGSAISLLTTAEPADVVHHLTSENVGQDHGSLPSSVMKDALRGRWRLSGSVLPAHSADEDGDLGEEEKGPGEYVIEPCPSQAGDGVEPADMVEAEGDLHIETEGVVPKYMYKMQFSFGNSGRKDGTRNNKLSWKGFWSYNRLTDDWGEFWLKNDRAFYWSRVKSYGMS